MKTPKARGPRRACGGPPALAACIVLVIAAGGPTPWRAGIGAQEVFEGEVRQLVTFRFVPGAAAEARTIFEGRALPLYERDMAMRSFRGYREVESSIPLDLVVVSSFDGMRGMDEHNTVVSALRGPDGLGIGGFYAAIGDLIVAHDDQFVRMLPTLSNGDPATRPRVAFVWYRVQPGQQARFEDAIGEDLVAWERATNVPSATGRFLLSDGWHYLRVLGFRSLGEYERYWEEASDAGHGTLDALTTKRREVILAPVPELSVR